MNKRIADFTRVSDKIGDSFSHQRGGDMVEKLQRRYPEAADKRHGIERAHDVLKGELNYASAMHRVAFSLDEGEISVFISYRIGIDAEAARTVAEVFRALSKNKVRVTFADEFTTRIAGRDFKSEIEAATKTAHWFVILVSDSDQPSAWCMYETGMFRASTTSNKMERLICLHHPNAKLHDAIDGFQAVEGDEKHLYCFLDGLFRQPDPLPGWQALDETLDDATLRAAAKRIANVLRPPLKPVTLTHSVSLEVRNPKQLAHAADLNALPVETDTRTANLFGKTVAPATWGQLVSNLPKPGAHGKWLEELVAVIRKAAAGDLIRPMIGTFECAEGGRVMRPVLHSMETDGLGDVFKFHLFFLEDFASTPAQGIPRHIRTLLRAVRKHNRVRWEVLERFAHSNWTAEDAEACIKAFSRIEREFQAEGGIDLEVLREHFEQSTLVDKIEVILEEWDRLRSPTSGSLTFALKQVDVVGIRSGMTACSKQNREFLELTVPELLKESKLGR